MSGTDKRPVRAALYCRMSVADLGDLEKVERQEEDCRAVCERMGWMPTEAFVDNNKSAWQKNRKRKRWDAMLEGIRNGQFDAIVVYHGDRLIRQPYDLEMLLNLAENRGVKLASPTGTRNLDNADDRFILRIEAAQACRESDNISRRTKRAKESRREKGIHEGSGSRAFGRNSDGTIREEEAEEIREAFARIASGEAMSALWREWERRGVPTVRGGKWRYTTFRQVLMRPDLAGLLSHQGDVVGVAANLEPIVDRQTWETIQALISGNKETYGGYRPRAHLLSGIPLCSGCRQPLGTGKGIYRCHWPSCPCPVSRNRANLDEYIIGRTLRRLSDPRVWEKAESNKALQGVDNAAAELELIEVRRQELVNEFANDDAMAPALLRKMLARLDERANEARGRLLASQATSVLAGMQGLSRAGWDALPLERRRAIVRELLRIEIFPAKRGPGLDEGSIHVTAIGPGATQG